MTLLSISPITGADLLRFSLSSFFLSLFLSVYLCESHPIDRLVPGSGYSVFYTVYVGIKFSI